jgi:hypothetical protein
VFRGYNVILVRLSITDYLPKFIQGPLFPVGPVTVPL